MGSGTSKQETTSQSLKIVTASQTNNLVLVGSTKTVPERIVEVSPPKIITMPDRVPEPIVYAAALRGDLVTNTVSNIIPGFT